MEMYKILYQKKDHLMNCVVIRRNVENVYLI